MALFAIPWWGMLSGMGLLAVGLGWLMQFSMRDSAPWVLAVGGTAISIIAFRLILIGGRSDKIELCDPILASFIALSFIYLLPRAVRSGKRLAISSLIFALLGASACAFYAIWQFTNNAFLAKVAIVAWILPLASGAWLLVDAFIVVWSRRSRPKHAKHRLS